MAHQPADIDMRLHHWISVCLVAVAVVLPVPGRGLDLKTENVFLITTDGLRWQEVFGGAEEQLLNKTNGGAADEAALRKTYWRDTPEARREVLMPFLWRVIAQRGQIYGNRRKGSEARLTNGHKFSYPGYNEFLTGAVDPGIDSNAKIPNPNTNVFEWLNQQPRFRGKVAAAVNWDVIPWILNVERSQLPVWSGLPLPPNAPNAFKVSPQLSELAADTTPAFHGMIYDSFIFQAAQEYVRDHRPRAFYLAFGETDEWAHKGRYDCYLDTAHKVDSYIQRLWETTQSLRAYRGKTTFIITTDHGRGGGPSAWRNHNKSTEGAEDIWIAILGPDTPPLGERRNCGPVTLDQIASTVAAFLGQDYRGAFPHAGPPIADAFER
jgi:hypothetical protein